MKLLLEHLHITGHTPRPARRRAQFKGEVLPETLVDACPRVRVADLPPGFLKKKWFEHLEQNQQIASCCRHPENHFIEAKRSHPEEPAPDIYQFFCDRCNKKHTFVCMGLEDTLPIWKVAA